VLPMIRPPRTLIASVALTGLLGLAACGDTSSDSSDSADEPAAETGDATPDEAIDCAASPGETVTVDIGDFVFDPTPVQVGVCDSVVWTNVHTQAHTSTGQGDKTWSTGNVQAEETSEPVLFDAAGDFAYICALHPFMKGTVEVS
jgi:plastocyanin